MIVVVLLSILVAWYPRLVSGYVLLIASAVWWPANNHTLEGPVIVPVLPAHGVALADLVGIVGVAIGLKAIWSRSSNWWVRAVSLLVPIGGAVAALATGG